MVNRTVDNIGSPKEDQTLEEEIQKLQTLKVINLKLSSVIQWFSDYKQRVSN